MKNLSKLIESYLFWKGEPVTLKKLSEVFETPQEVISEELSILEENLKERGIILLRKDDKVTLGTSVEASELIGKISKEELSKELSKAALETLSIVLYKGPVRRSEIDYIRGVNSQFIVRNLEVRGLVEKVELEGDSRVNLYKPTFDLLSHLGLQKVEELPEYNVLREAVKEFENTADENNHERENNTKTEEDGNT